MHSPVTRCLVDVVNDLLSSPPSPHQRFVCVLMSKSSSAIEIVATAAKLLADIGEIPVLSPLKPIGGILLTICQHAEVWIFEQLPP